MSNIRNPEYFSQEYDYGDMRWGNITPTDIDGLIEYHDICYVLFETKYNNTEPSRGQRIALERLNDDLQKVKPVITIIATHNIPASEVVNVANTIVFKYRWKGKWFSSDGITTTKQLTDRFINWVNKEYIRHTDIDSEPNDDEIPY